MNYTSLQSTRGFTLIEMLIVISIVAILASAYTLALREPIRDASVDASYASALSAFESARTRSIQGAGAERNGIKIERTQISIITQSEPDSPTSVIKLAPNLETNHDDTVVFFDRISGYSSEDSHVEVELSDTKTGEVVRTITITPEGHVY